MEEPLISVIIPVYNMELYLERCLDSVLNNTYRNLEVICIDDGSKDNSLEILRRYEAADPRIVVIAKENGGVSSARNAGLDRMTGDFVTFIDSDDFVHPQYFEQFVLAQRETNADLVIGGFRDVSDTDLPIDWKPIELDCPQRWKADCITVFKNHFLGGYSTARLISASLIKQIRFPIDVDYAEDALFFSSIWELTPDINCWVLNNKLYYYYKRQNSVTDVISCERRINTIRMFYRIAEERPEYKRIWIVKGMSLSLQFLNYYGKYLHDSESESRIAREMRKHLRSVLFSEYATVREKVFYTIKAFFPRIRSLKRMISVN